MTTTTTTCPDWCLTDHDGEAAALRAQHDAEGLNFSYDPGTYVTPHRSGDLTLNTDGIIRGARLEDDARNGYVVTMYEIDPDGSGMQRDISDLPVEEAVKLAQIILDLSERAMAVQGAAR